MTHAAIALQGLSKRFGTVQAAGPLDLTVQAGEVVAVLGPNGAGKTTMLDMILGLSDPTTGSVLIHGAPPRQAIAAGRISAVLQTGGLLRDLTVQETVAAVAAIFGVEERTAEVIRRADLTEISGRRVGKCSGGEQQRVKFALALIPDPDVLILDEPTAGMDVTARRRFWAAMTADAQAGRTILFATHYLEEAEQYARRTVVMNRGLVVADAPTAQLRASLGGQTVSALVPEGAEATLAALPGVTHLETLAEGRITLRTEDSDAVARLLLTELGGSDIEIAPPALETAFTELTEPTEENPS